MKEITILVKIYSEHRPIMYMIRPYLCKKISNLIFCYTNCGVREFMTPAHFILRPKAWAEKRYCRGCLMEVQNGLRIWPRTILCSAPQSAPKRKGEHSAGAAQVKGCQYCNKTLCTWQDHALQFLQSPPTTLGMGWQDKSYGLTGQVLNPRKLSLYVDIEERVNANIKRKERPYRRGGQPVSQTMES